MSSPLLILDRDGVINHDSDDFIKSAEEWRPIDGSLDAIARLHRAGWRIAVATNQSGVGRGLLSIADLESIHRRMEKAIEAAGGRLDAIVYCPHHPDDRCDCRKPRPGMLRAIGKDFETPLSQSVFIGDSVRDVEAARAVGARPILVLTGSGMKAQADLGGDAVETYADLAQAADALLAEETA